MCNVFIDFDDHQLLQFGKKADLMLLRSPTERRARVPLGT